LTLCAAFGSISAMVNLSTTEDREKPCEREHDEDGWWCVHDHTDCLWNDGYSTCNCPGESISPLNDDEESETTVPWLTRVELEFLQKKDEEAR